MNDSKHKVIEDPKILDYPTELYKTAHRENEILIHSIRLPKKGEKMEDYEKYLDRFFKKEKGDE